MISLSDNYCIMSPFINSITDAQRNLTNILKINDHPVFQNMLHRKSKCHHVTEDEVNLEDRDDDELKADNINHSVTMRESNFHLKILIMAWIIKDDR